MTAVIAAGILAAAAMEPGACSALPTPHARTVDEKRRTRDRDACGDSHRRGSGLDARRCDVRLDGRRRTCGPAWICGSPWSLTRVPCRPKAPLAIFESATACPADCCACIQIALSGGFSGSNRRDTRHRSAVRRSRLPAPTASWSKRLDSRLLTKSGISCLHQVPMRRPGVPVNADPVPRLARNRAAYRCAQRPPATSTNVPVLYDASSDSSHRMARATSTARPPRRIGSVGARRSTRPGSPPSA